ncbi:efflux RND transporter periplasmic adaptor subunit [Desulfovibrio ferrophilus]|uniref:Efflux transporter, RND family, MFP subunit n=1 Tax=Desulfovibrio ferrophilus TaxID=241368 RepID=A0A2Z6B0R0_9BACT|nr:efflux RND transporter periplasmic adaptor subunit [Desulfovibrio ferrophilus]BBD09020.1 efflux transporter, RND family, MFP subunit [Desulfovibrio ferrophilus]
MKTSIITLITLIVLTLPTGTVAQDKPQGPPPTLIETAKSGADSVAPRSDFVGTVYYPEVSEVASEVAGRVLNVHFEEGRRVNAGADLVTMDTAIAVKHLIAAQGYLDEAKAAQELAKIELKRREELIKSGSISTQEFDNAFYALQEVQNKARALEAVADRLQLEITKSRVPSPFAGIVLERKVERGEWIAAGAVVATVALDEAMDVIINVPETVLPFISVDQTIEVTIGGKATSGKIFAIIPRGDVGTRTFPIKIRIPGTHFAQGMQATAHLPVGAKVKSVIVPRDAVTILRGQPMVFAAVDGKAQMIPVNVVAYLGLLAAVNGPGLAEGMDLVIKGNERLYPGAPVRTAGAKQ